MNTPASPTTPAAVTPDHGDNLVGRLQTSEIFRDYQQAFQTATGLPLVLRAPGAFQAPMAGARNLNPFCTLMAARSKTCAACLAHQQQAEAEAVHGVATIECFAGLNDSLVPVRLGETVVAYLQTGQIFFRAPTERQFRTAVKELGRWSPVEDTAVLREAFFRSRVLAKGHYHAMLRLLTSFAEHLAMVANEVMIKSATAEPPAVAKARAYIAEHISEPLSLDQVARAANMSAFYFCKVFKAGTGLTLTHYIARARIERTKQLLLNANTRISEAAYEAGFQSLSQFNRVFRRIAGESPTAYREHLHGRTTPARSAAPLAFAA
ncbi:MAG: helix-turn-helix domain-containing protein [Opitutaceae bacterium]|nr:helix-turn-helix domain-containing protein [Opitutaceae bacterium]